MHKKALILAILSLFIVTPVLAAPYFRQEAGLVPIVDSVHYLGTTTPSTLAWRGLIVDEICLTADTCKTAWPTSTGAPFAWTPTSWGVSTSTTLGFLNGFLSTASSTFTFAPKLSTLTSALLLTDGDGLTAEYAGTSCTNQFVRSLSALGAATCATVGSADVSLAELTATNASLTFSGTYNGSTARTIGVNLAHDFTWTGIHDFGGSSSLEIPNGASPTVDGAGEIAVDTTTGQLKWYDGAKVQTLTGTTTKSFNIASTTLDAMGNKFNSATSTFLLANFPEAMTMSSFYCTASTTGTAIVRFGDPTGNYTQEGVITSGSLTNVSSNNTWTAYEGLTMQASSTAGQVSRLTCTVNMYNTAD